nr:hypothetical protein [Tanacetum cinerariifolium]
MLAPLPETSKPPDSSRLARLLSFSPLALPCMLPCRRRYFRPTCTLLSMLSCMSPSGYNLLMTSYLKALFFLVLGAATSVAHAQTHAAHGSAATKSSPSPHTAHTMAGMAGMDMAPAALGPGSPAAAFHQQMDSVMTDEILTFRGAAGRRAAGPRPGREPPRPGVHRRPDFQYRFGYRPG